MGLWLNLISVDDQSSRSLLENPAVIDEIIAGNMSAFMKFKLKEEDFAGIDYRQLCDYLGNSVSVSRIKPNFGISKLIVDSSGYEFGEYLTYESLVLSLKNETWVAMFTLKDSLISFVERTLADNRGLILYIS